MDRHQEIFQELIELLICTLSTITNLFYFVGLVAGITKQNIQNAVAHKLMLTYIFRI
jgi:hypothetical protein